MMEKYKSLVYREWKVSKKFYVPRVTLLGLFFILLGYVAILIAKEPTNDSEAATLGVLCLSYLFVACIAAMVGDDNGVHKADVDTGWLRFSWALPLTAFEVAMGKYIFKAVMILIGTIFMFVSVWAFTALTDFTLMAEVVYAFFWVLDVVLLFNVFRDLFMLRAVDKKTLKKLSTIFGIVGVALLFLPDILLLGNWATAGESFYSQVEQAFATMNNAKLIDLITIPDFWGWIGILLLFVILAAGFVVTWKSCERRNAS